MKIDRLSSDENQPFLNLLPLAKALEDAGNEVLGDGFQRDPHGGWRCRMRNTLELETLRANFDIPESISLSEEWDSILDRLTWCVIEGPGNAEARRKAMSDRHH